MRTRLATVVEHASKDVRVVCEGQELARFANADKAKSYAHGWNQLNPKKEKRDG